MNPPSLLLSSPLFSSCEYAAATITVMARSKESEVDIKEGERENSTEKRHKTRVKLMAEAISTTESVNHTVMLRLG
jgi:hypothetical protein